MRRTKFLLDRPDHASARELVARLYGQGVAYHEMPEIVLRETGKRVPKSNCQRYCQRRIVEEAERAERLRIMAEAAAKGLASGAPAEIKERLRAALSAVLVNLLVGADGEAQKTAIWALKDLAKLEVEEKRLALGYAQLEQEKKKLEAQIAGMKTSGQKAVKEIEQAVSKGKAVLPAEVLASLKEAYGIAET